MAAYGAYGAYGAGAAPVESPRAKLTRHVNEFNSTLKRLTVDLVTRYPDDPKIARAQKRINLAIDASPVTIIEIVGPYLWKYRKEICTGQAEFFMTNDYDTELQESEDAEKADIAAYIIPKVKDAWRAAKQPERDAYTETVQDLLDSYMEYVALTMEKE